MLALLVVPVIEVFIIIKVGQSIGGWNTLAILVLWSALGAWIVKREFGHAFGALRQAFASGRMPARELADAALVLIGGTLLLAPGFLTDAIGLFFLIPFTRPIMRRLLEGAVASRMFGSVGMPAATIFSTSQRIRTSGFDAQGFGTSPRPQQPYPTADSFAQTGERPTSGASRTTSRSRGAGQVVEGEIID